MFKVGDIISPNYELSHNYKSLADWHNACVIEYNALLKEATLELNTGEIVHEFNLDPQFGVQFKVVGRK